MRQVWFIKIELQLMMVMFSLLGCSGQERQKAAVLNQTNPDIQLIDEDSAPDQVYASDDIVGDFEAVVLVPDLIGLDIEPISDSTGDHSGNDDIDIDASNDPDISIEDMDDLIEVGDPAEDIIVLDPGEDCCCPQEWTIDFDYDAENNPIWPGEKLDQQYQAWGIRLGAVDFENQPQWSISFDSSQPTGQDWDLQTPGYGWGNDVSYNNLWIMAENIVDQNHDGYVDDPDDNSAGGCLLMWFDRPTWVGLLDVIDIEEEGSRVSFWYENQLVADYAIPANNDNSVQHLRFDEPPKADYMSICLLGSGAIDNIMIYR